MASILAVFIYYFLGFTAFVFNPMFSDSVSYVDASKMLYEEYKPHFARPILFAFLIGLSRIIYENPSMEQYVFFSIMINMGSWMLSLAILYKTLQIYLNNKIAFWLTTCMLFSFGIVIHNYLLMTESLSLLFLSSITYFLLRFSFSKDNAYVYLIFACSLLNLLILIRPGFLYIGFIASIALIVYVIHNRLKFNKNFILFIASIGLVFVQYLAMYKAYGKATISFIDKITWYRYLGAQASADALNIDFENAIQARDSILTGKSPIEINQICSEDFNAQIRTNLPNIFPNYFKNLVTNSIGGSNGILTAINAHKSKGKIYILTLRGFFYLTMLQNACYVLLLLIAFLLIGRNIFEINFAILILSGLILYVIMTSAISFWQGDRFHLVIYPIILVVFSYAVKFRMEKTGNRVFSSITSA